jgi:hypothetical protein
VTADGDITIVAGGKLLEGILRFELRAPVEGMPRSFRWTITERYPDPSSQLIVTPAQVSSFTSAPMTTSMGLMRV